MNTHCGEGFNAWGYRYKDFVITKLKGIFEWIACGYGGLNGLHVYMDTDMMEYGCGYGFGYGYEV